MGQEGKSSRNISDDSNEPSAPGSTAGQPDNGCGEATWDAAPETHDTGPQVCLLDSHQWTGAEANLELPPINDIADVMPSLTLKGSIAGYGVGMLLDSGATANLMHPKLAFFLGLDLGVTAPLTVTLADGSRRQCTKQATGVRLTLKNVQPEETVERMMSFYVADMPGGQHDIILGMPFPVRENPMVWIGFVAQWPSKIKKERPSTSRLHLHKSRGNHCSCPKEHFDGRRGSQER